MHVSWVITAAAAAFTGASVVLGSAEVLFAPGAAADTLPNGLTVTCNQDSDFHATCIIGGCPRVNGDHVVDAVHVQFDSGGSQQEYGFKCISGQTARQAIDGGGEKMPLDHPVGFGVQACRKNKGLGERDDCTPFSHYVYTPPAKPAAPAPKPAVPAPAPAPAAPPAAAPAPVAAPVTDAITLSFGHPGLGNVTATVSNSSALTAKCTYDATPSNTHRDFTVNPHSSTNLSFNGLNTGTNYHATVNCSDASGKQKQPIGTSSADVRF